MVNSTNSENEDHGDKPSAGWYPDVEHPDRLQRFWRGSQWTARTRSGNVESSVDYPRQKLASYPPPDPATRYDDRPESTPRHQSPARSSGGSTRGSSSSPRSTSSTRTTSSINARRLREEAPGLRTLGRVIEFVGWVGVIGAVLAGLIVSQQETTEFTTTVLGGLEPHTRRTVEEGLTLGFVGAFSSLITVTLGRSVQVLALYFLARIATD